MTRLEFGTVIFGSGRRLGGIVKLLKSCQFQVRWGWCRWGFGDQRGQAPETIDLAKDSCILRNHLGSLECRLCRTLHTNEGSYLARTQGKKHQNNLARRAACDAKGTQLTVAPTQSNIQRKVSLETGRPGYRVTKVRAKDNGEEMMVQVHLLQIKTDDIPRRRFMSAWEQKREHPNRAHQYLIVDAEPTRQLLSAFPRAR
ncbi:hypothetical protein DEU56DRAFT_751329 [Suillus clintonianus]|uniref:uncharacterized protein n=1 Tax=Suillus clintonianus TaxID=1904413 RepID=UPI001B85EE01|nr:uncharacterized protein DEU56DRAFT_751329 [Suillus clintonianus]KAG2154647.1 hypothetical protein DEU56DRAFT_751329 [Suillus clintonianus]